MKVGPERGIDLFSVLAFPPRFAAHGLGWLATASRGARLHAGEAADHAARSLGADAVTVGDEILVRHGRFDTTTPRGLALLAHELVHVDQQRRAGGRALTVSDPARHLHEHEALSVEHEVLELLRPGRPASMPLAPRMGERANEPAPARLPPHSPPSSGPFRAAEDRPAESATSRGPAADPGDVADEVYRMLRRRLRIERERVTLGRS